MRRRRMQPEDLLRLNALNTKGQPVPLSAFATHALDQRPDADGPLQRLSGDAHLPATPRPGHSTGEAMDEMERLAAQLPAGFGYEWTGQSREEKLSGSQPCRAARLLRCWPCSCAWPPCTKAGRFPMSVLLVVPLGVLGALLARHRARLAQRRLLQGRPDHHHRPVAKNAMLIIEFAKDLQAQGMAPIDAAIAACHLRFRPIMMTSLAFILGVLPLVIASGAGCGQPARHRHRRDGRHDHRRPRWPCSSCPCSLCWCANYSRAAKRSAIRPPTHVTPPVLDVEEKV